MPADAGTLLAIRRWVGTSPDDTDLNARWDRLGNVEQTALEVLETRRADMVAGGRSFSVSGFYSQGSTAEAVKSLDDDIARLKAVIAGNPSGVGMARLSRSDLRR